MPKAGSKQEEANPVSPLRPTQSTTVSRSLWHGSARIGCDARVCWWRQRV